MSPRQIYLFRHGQTDWNKEGRIQGHLDVPLNELGRFQAARLRPLFRHLKIQGALSSDLSRAHESARLACEGLGLHIHVDSGLREVDLGKLQGLNAQEIENQFGTEFSQALRRRTLTDEDLATTSSEKSDLVVARALSAMERFLTSPIGTGVERLAVASHGGVIRRILQFALAEEELGSWVTNGTVYPLELRWEPEPQWRIGASLPIPL